MFILKVLIRTRFFTLARALLDNRAVALAAGATPPVFLSKSAEAAEFTELMRIFCERKSAKSAQAVGRTEVSSRVLKIEWRMNRKRRVRRRASAAGKGLSVTVSAIHDILYHVGTRCQEIFWFHFGNLEALG